MPLFSTDRGIFMADSHVVTGLVDKRREIAGVIDRHRQEMARLADDLAHLEATIKLFAPDPTLTLPRHISDRPPVTARLFGR